MAYRHRPDNNWGNRRNSSNNGWQGRNCNNTPSTSRQNDDERGRGWQHNITPGSSRFNYNERKHPIGFRELERLANDISISPSDLAIKLSTERSGLNLRLQTDMDNGKLQLLLKVFGKMCKDNDSSIAVNHVLTDILNSEYMNKLNMFFHGLILESKEIQNEASIHVSNCIFLIKSMLGKLPNDSKKKMGILVLFLETVISNLTTVDWSNNDIENRFKEVQEMVEELNKKEERIQKRIQHASDRMSLMHEEQPPDNFREISVFPQINDIHLKEDPFVRTNLVNSKYQSVDHYLDVQFRLLREDFIRPLREGIMEFFQSGDGTQKVKKLQNIKTYQEVSILFPVITQRGMCHRLQFSTKHLKGINWQTTKKLIYGNLVCLSSDKFQTDFLFGVINDRDPKDLEEGQIEIEFVFEQTRFNQQNLRKRFGQEDNILNRRVVKFDPFSLIDMTKTYLMVETEAYFEAYKHILSGLKEIKHLPMDRYIVECNDLVRAPLQFRHNQILLDFSSILVIPPTDSKKVRVLDFENWPTKEELGLDDSQRKALVTGVTNELAIIQGPPGTGKTCVGLIIMKLLLKNGQVGNTARSPMLVVCYTNHALDQFLEGIAKFHPNGIVRVGSRCKTEELERYSLSNVRREYSYNNLHLLWQAVRDYKSELQALEERIKHHENVLKLSTDNVLKLQELESVIPYHLIKQFGMGLEKIQKRPSRIMFYLDDKILIRWLGLDVNIYDNLVSKYPHVFNEVILQLTYPLESLQFERKVVIEAILATGETDISFLLNWLGYHQYDLNNRRHVISIPELVLGILKDVGVGQKNDFLHKRGYHDIEIQCVHFILGYGTTIYEMDRWLSRKRMEYLKPESDAKNQFEQLEEEENIENEVDIIQGQRLLDDDYKTTRFRRRKENEEETKYIIRKIATIAFEDYEDITDSKFSWEFQRQEKKKKKFQVRKNIQTNDVMTMEESLQVGDIQDLLPKERWRLYRFWVHNLKITIRQNIQYWIEMYNLKAKRLNELRREEDYEVLNQADVIGMTTTGAAKYRDIVNRLPVKVVIVEEAAEVLEAHIITAMPRTTQHLILIGDHQQLQPSPTVYELAIKFNLNVSLFERMIKNGIPFTKLSVQHRMRPQIADLIRPNIYRELSDADNVNKYENVRGIQKNVYFITHEVKEDSVSDGKTKVNQHEADFLAALCQHILCQGYRPEQITILAAYIGQLFAFKNIMKRNFSEKVRVTAVDNFQGEENDIILLSLVRSNEEGKIGFLSIKNRVCVALSRAKMGLYCIANFKMLEENNSLWQNITSKLKDEGCYGPGLPLVCHNHPDFVKQVQTVEDFKLFPEGGCGKPCKFRLECGHVCTRSCHADDEKHLKFKCRKPCETKCEKGHLYKKDCHERCGDCYVQVKKIIPRCQHEQLVECYRNPTAVSCLTPCPKNLNCGHKCGKLCGDNCTKQCLEKVKVTFQCGHVNKVCCYLSNTSGVELMKNCFNVCNEELKCGHKCKGTCGECKQGRLHVRCMDKCTRINLCGHPCKENCSTKCPPCKEKCQTKCEHSECKLPCFASCQPCKEKCLWKCKHQKCDNKCSDECSIKPCNKPCENIRSCGHQCIGLCGEPCPKLCRICDKEKVTEIFFGDEDKKDARFVELNCGHIFTYENLDRWMYKDINATTDGENSIDITIQLKECPKCKTVIRRSRRYGNIINNQLKLINQIKRITYGHKTTILNCKKKKIQLLIKTNQHKNFFFRFQQLDLQLERDYLSLSELNVIETKVKVMILFDLLSKKLAKLLREKKKKLEKCEKDIFEEIDNILRWLDKNRLYFSDQEIIDVDCEKKRIEAKIQYIMLKHNIQDIGVKNKDVDKNMSEVQQKLFEEFKRYEESMQKGVNEYFDKIIKDGNLNLPFEDATHKMVIRAMEFTKGYWFQCKNGHMYAIGKCDGAQEKGVCPECKDNIGGTGHRLAEGNRVATVMDGAIEGAYDEATRLNLVPENFQ